MKTSNKILILCLLIGISLPIIDVLIVNAKKQKREITIEEYFVYKNGKPAKNTFSIEKLQNFKHLKIIGKEHSQIPKYPFKFSYADSCFALSSKNGKRNEFTFEYQNDTLILNIEKYKISPDNSFTQFHLFAPELASITLIKSPLQFEVNNKRSNNQNLQITLYESRFYLSGHTPHQSEKYFLSVNVNGENSLFSSEIDAQTMTVNLKEKSVLQVDEKINFKSFSGKISNETEIVNLPSEYAKNLVIENKK